ncbi:hypothetical protein MPLSOD_100282 [Mesorhizobium sp. SOD10]|nr:hypothetical protein MPLSOD_100282 [Mesorhizobium sp. SOD10]
MRRHRMPFANTLGDPSNRFTKSALEAHLFPVDRPRHSPYVPRNFEGGVLSPRERVAQPVEQLTFNQ